MTMLADVMDVVGGHAWVLVPLGVFAFLTVASIADAVRKVMQTRSKEATRREIAAYVAEGSMTPEDAERLLAAGGKSERRCG